MNPQFSGANFPVFTQGGSTFQPSQAPVAMQAAALSNVSVFNPPAPPAKKKTKNVSVAEKRCDMVQKVVLNQDRFGLTKAECFLTMSQGDIQKYSAYVQYWIQRGRNFSVKAVKAARDQ